MPGFTALFVAVCGRQRVAGSVCGDVWQRCLAAVRSDDGAAKIHAQAS